MENECRSQTDLSHLEGPKARSVSFESLSESKKVTSRQPNRIQEDTKTKTEPKLRNKGMVIYEFSYGLIG